MSYGLVTDVLLNCFRCFARQAGYVGEDVESILHKLYMESGQDIERCQRGIVYLDEIDKVTFSREPKRHGTQSFLALLPFFLPLESMSTTEEVWPRDPDVPRADSLPLPNRSYEVRGVLPFPSMPWGLGKRCCIYSGA